MAGAHEFDMLPYLYELVRRMIHGTLDFAHLGTPEWLIEELYSWLRPSGRWRRTPLLPPRFVGGVLTFVDLTLFLLSTDDVHVRAKVSWLLKCRWGGALAISWSPDVRVGRFPWDDTGAISAPGIMVDSDPDTSPTSSLSSQHVLPFTTGGLSHTFDRRAHEMLHLAKFELLTQSVCAMRRRNNI